jgi:hypothetical protein
MNKGEMMTLTSQQKELILKFLASNAEKNNLVKEVAQKK